MALSVRADTPSGQTMNTCISNYFKFYSYDFIVRFLKNLCNKTVPFFRFSEIPPVTFNNGIEHLSKSELLGESDSSISNEKEKSSEVIIEFTVLYSEFQYQP